MPASPQTMTQTAASRCESIGLYNSVGLYSGYQRRFSADKCTAHLMYMCTGHVQVLYSDLKLCKHSATNLCFGLPHVLRLVSKDGGWGGRAGESWSRTHLEGEAGGGGGRGQSASRGGKVACRTPGGDVGGRDWNAPVGHPGGMEGA